MKVLILIFLTVQALAWGKRGHALVTEAAGYALSAEKSYFKSHSFDLAYYANVPDIIWKRLKTYPIERHEHYVDLDIVKRSLARPPGSKIEVRQGKRVESAAGLAAKNGDWPEKRSEMLKRVPDLEKAGFALWRIAELCDSLEKISRESATGRKSKASQQKRWLSLAGVLSHYVADLSQPLHTTENHDGQLTGQKGIHVYYETLVVNELYPAITTQVFEAAKNTYESIKSRKQESCFALSRELAEASHLEVGALLEADKKVGRSDYKKSSDAYRGMIANQLSRGAAYLALIWSKYSDLNFDEKEFYEFDEHPKYIKPARPL